MQRITTVIEVNPPTVRELEVFALVASGRSTKEVAYQLGISTSTAKAHRTRVMLKLRVNNIADLTRAAIRMGVVEL